MRVWRTMLYCRANPVALVFEYLISSEFWISALKASMLIDCNFRDLIVCWSVRQSINKTSIAPIFQAKPGSVAPQPNQCSTAKSRKQFRNINRQWGVTVSMGGRPNQRDFVFTYFLKVATELAERIDSGRLFQRDGAQE